MLGCGLCILGLLIAGIVCIYCTTVFKGVTPHLLLGGGGGGGGICCHIAKGESTAKSHENTK